MYATQLYQYRGAYTFTSELATTHCALLRYELYYADIAECCTGSNIGYTLLNT